VTKSPADDEKRQTSRRCRWCGRPLSERAGPGRPPEYCRPSHRQRDYEARRRARELGLAESELIVAREAVDALHDQIYLLECAIDDASHDLGEDEGPEMARRAFHAVVEAARPLLRRPLGGT